MIQEWLNKAKAVAAKAVVKAVRAAAAKAAVAKAVRRNRTLKSRSRLGRAFAPLTTNYMEENLMFKESLFAAFLAAIAFSPAFAADDMCTDAHMKQMDDMVAKMADAAKKKEATMHLDMSKDEMKKGNKEGCMKHMKEAHSAMGM